MEFDSHSFKMTTTMMVKTAVTMMMMMISLTSGEPSLMWTQRFGSYSKFRGLALPPGVRDFPDGRAGSSFSRPLLTKYGSLGHDPRTDTVYWTDQSLTGAFVAQEREKSFDWAAGNAPKVLNASSLDIRHFALDWSTNNFYFIDSSGVISVATEREGNTIVNVLHMLGLDDPVSIVCDVTKGLLFWSDASSASPRIERSTLSGVDRRIIIKTSDAPSSVAILKDGGDLLFWVEQRSGSVMSSDYEGKGQVKEWGYGGARIPRGLAAYQNFIFLTDESGLSVEMFDRESKRSNSLVLDALPVDIVIITAEDPSHGHDCDDLVCERFCFNLGSGRGQCGCNETLNGALCDGVQLLFSTPESILFASANVTASPLNAGESLAVRLSSTTSEVLNATFLDVQHSAGSVFWGDRQAGSVYTMRESSRRDGLRLGGPWEISAQQTVVEGLAVDWFNSLLFWLDASVRHVMGSKVDGRYHSVYANDLRGAQALAVDPIGGILYWSQETDSVSGRDIVYTRYHDDGNAVRRLVATGHVNVGDLVMDVRLNRLYWSDPVSSRIHGYDLSAKVEVKFVGRFDHVEKFTVLDMLVVSRNPDVSQPLKFTDLNSAASGSSVTFPASRVNVTSTTGDVVVYGDYLQPIQTQNACPKDNPCQQICLSSGRESVCRCAIGYKKDGNRCQTKILTTAVYFADAYHKQIYQISPPSPSTSSSSASSSPSSSSPSTSSSSSSSSSSPSPVYEGLVSLDDTAAFPHSSLVRPLQFVANGPKGLLYVLDMGEIKVYDASTNKMEAIRPNDQSEGVKLNVTQMALDTIDNCLYLTDLNGNSLARLDLNNKSVSVWKGGLSAPFAVVVDESQRLLYWSEKEFLKSAPLGDPSNVTCHLSLSNITSINLRSEENVIYIADINLGSVVSHNLIENTTTKLYQSRGWKIYKVASDDHSVYFVCWNKRGVYRIPRRNQSGDAELLSVPIFSRIVDISFIPLFVHSNGITNGLPVAGIVVGLLLLLLLLILLLILLLCCLYKRRKNVQQNPPESVPPPDSKERCILDGVANDAMFYTRGNTVSIIPIEWQDGVYDDLPDDSYSSSDPAVDSTVDVSHRASLILSEEVPSGLDNSRDILLVNRSKVPAVRRQISGTVSQIRGANPSNRISILSNGARKHDSTANRRRIPSGSRTPSGGSTPVGNRATPSWKETPNGDLNGGGPSSSSTEVHSIPGADQSEITTDPQGICDPASLIGPEKGKGDPSGRFVLIPPKLHVQPRGFAPASHSVPAAIKSTWGRIKNAAKFLPNNNSNC